MPRSARDSDEEMEAKPGRRTRTVGLDSSLRRSSRIKPAIKQNESSPESPLSDTSNVSNTTGNRVTRGRRSTMDVTVVERSLRSRRNSVSSEISEADVAPGTPTKRTKSNTVDTPKGNTRVRRLTRAGSEAKSPMPATRLTRRTRASSVGLEGTGDAESNHNELDTTSARTRKRASIIPSEPTVMEQKEQFDKILVVELDRSLPEINEDIENESKATLDSTPKSEVSLSSPKKLNVSVKTSEPQSTEEDSNLVKGLHDNGAETVSSDSIQLITEEESVDEKPHSDKNTLEIIESSSGDKDVTVLEHVSSNVSETLSQDSNQDASMETELKAKNLNDSLGEEKSLSDKENQTANIVSNMALEKNAETTISNLLQSQNPFCTSPIIGDKSMKGKYKLLVKEGRVTKRRLSKDPTEVMMGSISSVIENKNINDAVKSPSVNTEDMNNKENLDNTVSEQPLKVSEEKDSLNKSAEDDHLDTNTSSFTIHDSSNKSRNENTEDDSCAKDVGKADDNESTNIENELSNEDSQRDMDVSTLKVDEIAPQSSIEDNSIETKEEIESLDKSECVKDSKLDNSDVSADTNQIDDKETANQPIENEPIVLSQETEVLNKSEHEESDDAMDCSDLIAISVSLTDETSTNISDDAVEKGNTSSTAVLETTDVSLNSKDLTCTIKNTDDVASVVKNSQSSIVTECPAELTEEAQNNEEISEKSSISKTRLSTNRKSLSKSQKEEELDETPAMNTSLSLKRKSLNKSQIKEDSETTVMNTSLSGKRKSLSKTKNKEKDEETPVMDTSNLKRKSMNKLEDKEELEKSVAESASISKRKSVGKLEEKEESAKASEMGGSTPSRRKSVDKSKSVENKEASEVDQDIQRQSEENMEVDDDSENVENLFQDIPADEWKKNAAEKNTDSINSMLAEKLENESEVECDLVLVNREAWLAAENIKAAREKEAFDYDSDDTVVLKRKSDFQKAQNTVNDEKPEEVMSAKKRKSLNKSKIKETEENESKEENLATPAKKREVKLSVSSSSKKKVNLKQVDESETFNTNESENESKDSVVSAEKTSAKKKKLKRNISTVVHVDSDSDDYMDNMNSDSDNNNVTLPKFLFARADDDDDVDDDDDASSKKSVDSDIRREYNLDGDDDAKFSDDDVPGDQCRASESESSDPNDNGSDLDDFIVDDDEVEDEDESDEEAADDDAKDDIEDEDEQDKDGEDSEVEEGDEQNEVERKKLAIVEEEEDKQENKMAEESQSEESVENEISLKVTESDSTEEDIEEEKVSQEKKGRNKTEVENGSKKKKKSPMNVSLKEDEDVCNLSNVSFTSSQKKKKLMQKQNEFTLIDKMQKLNKSMECSTPKSASLKREKFEISAQTIDPDSEGSPKKRKAGDISLKAESNNKVLNKSTENASSVLHRSLPIESVDFKEKKSLLRSTKVTELNKTVLAPYSETPTTKYLKKDKLNESAPTLKLDRSYKKLLKTTVIEDSQMLIKTEDVEQSDTDEIEENVSLKKKLLKVANSILETDQQKKRKKRKQEKIETSVSNEVPQEDTSEIITDTPAKSELDDELIFTGEEKKKKKKKKKVLETEELTAEESQEKVEEPKVSDTIPDKKKKKKKKKKKVADNVSGSDNVETETQAPVKEVVKPEKVKSKSNDTSNEKPKKKQKIQDVPKVKASKKVAKKEQPELSDSDNAPEVVAFSKSREAALESIKRATENIKANKEMKKKKQREHLEKMQQEKEAKVQKESKRSVKTKIESSKKGIKRLPEDFLENLSDLPSKPLKKRKVTPKEEPILPSRSMSYSKEMSTSSCGSTTQFDVVNLQKIKKKRKKVPAVVSFRQKMLARNSREPVAAYLMYLEKQKATGRDKFTTKPY